MNGLAEKTINLKQWFPNWQDGELSVGALVIAGTVAVVGGIALGLLMRGVIPPDPAN